MGDPKRDLETLGGLARDFFFGKDEPGETLAKHLVEHGHETSPAIARAVARAVAPVMKDEEKPAPQKDPRAMPRTSGASGDPDCAGCRVARRNGGKACVEHS